MASPKEAGGKKPQSYKDLEIYQLAYEGAVRIHRMTLEKLPKFEMFAEGDQIWLSTRPSAARSTPSASQSSPTNPTNTNLRTET